ncbi:MOSC domain-containing protein [Salinactinospora qingdaonensis]|uniref:MOSC domain-containing protein n=1 Tax=Salinactinospora qingdaonensis TaxID=702744 RepID=A0ABP7G8E8_9ACTN
MDSGNLRSVNVGRIAEADWAGKLGRTAIDKRPVSGPVAVGPLGLDGDEQADKKNHGGHDQAVYAYAREELDWWAEQLGRPLRDGVFGENLTIEGFEVTRALLGERWRVGTTLLEVVSPRVPCAVFRNWLDEPAWVKRFTDEARTGAYLRVIEPGHLAAGDTVTVEYRPDHGIDLVSAFRASPQRDIALLRRILDIPGRAQEWERVFEKVQRQVSRTSEAG